MSTRRQPTTFNVDLYEQGLDVREFARHASVSVDRDGDRVEIECERASEQWLFVLDSADGTLLKQDPPEANRLPRWVGVVLDHVDVDIVSELQKRTRSGVSW